MIAASHPNDRKLSVVMNPIARIGSLAAVAVLSLGTAQPADDLDTFIKAQMSQRQVNGLSLAHHPGRQDRKGDGVRRHGERRG